MGGAKTTKVPALHGAGKALTDRDALDVHALTFDEVIGGELRTDVDQGVFGHAELGQDRLGLDLSLGETDALGVRGVLSLAGTSAELQRRIAVAGLGALSDDGAAVERKHGYRHVGAIGVEVAGHAQLLGDQACALRLTHRAPLRS